MSKVEKFEDLVVWQMGREITKEIYGITSGIGQRDFGFCDQIRRAAVSIMNNVAEGYERGSKKDFTRGTLIRVRQDDRMEYREINGIRRKPVSPIL